MSHDVNSLVLELRERRRNSPDMKVGTMTVLAYYDDDVVGRWCCDRVHALAAKHPSRVIILDGTRPEQDRHVGVSCPDHDDCVRTRGDWVELGVAGTPALLLASAIATLKLPEAPIVLIWVGNSARDNPAFEALARNVRTIVFNTSVVKYDSSALHDLADFARERSGATISDLAYLRLYPWQEAVAHFFDHGHTVDELYDIRTVEITCGSDPEAIYLLGWLASRLDWIPAGAAGYTSRKGTPIEFSIVRKGLPRRILKIALSSANSDFVAEIDDERAEAIMLTVTGEKTHPGRARPINNIDLAALVERAILTGHTDRVFRETLLAAGALLEKRGDS